MTEALHDEALLLSPYLDRVLEPAEAARLDAHLAGCDACRRQLEGLQRTVGLVKTLPHERMPYPVSIPVQRPQSWAWRSALMPLAGAAVALVLVVGAYQLGRNGAAPGPSTAYSQLSKGRGAAAPLRDSAQSEAVGRGAADGVAFSARAVSDTGATLNITTDRTAYARADTVVITTRTTGVPNRATLQLDRSGYRVAIRGGAVTGSGEVRTTLALASVSPALAPGDYRIVATLPLQGDAQLVVETSITVT